MYLLKILISFEKCFKKTNKKEVILSENNGKI